MAIRKTTKEQIENSMSHRVRVATGLTLKMYCEARKLNYSNLCKGYISNKAARILKKDGIDVDATRPRSAA